MPNLSTTANASSIRMPAFWLLSLVVVIAYFLLGVAADLITQSTQIGAPIFPAAGLALAACLLWGYRILPAITIGAALAFWYSHAKDLSVAQSFLPLLIGIGAGAQAAAGRFLVRRFGCWPSALDSTRPILSFLILIGPIACLISASIATLSLLIAEAHGADAITRTWVTWWQGDMFGAVLFTPPLLAAFAEPQKLWRPRLLTLLLCCIFSMLVLIMVLQALQHFDRERQRAQFVRGASQQVSSVSSKLRDIDTLLQSLQQLVLLNPQLTRAQFKQFSSHFLEHLPGIQALGLIVPVDSTERATFEQRIQQEGFPRFSIVDRDANNELSVAQPADEYLTIQYVEPLSSNIRAMGLNVLSLPVARAAIMRATAENMSVVTEPFTLTQEIARQRGVVSYLPVRTADGRLLGVVYTALRMNDFMQRALTESATQGVEICLFDSAAQAYGNAVLVGDENCHLKNSLYEDAITFGERQWRVLLSPTVDYAGNHELGYLLNFQSFGALASLLFMSFVLLSTGHRRRVEALVDERTSDLEAASEQLHLLAYYDQLTGLPNRSRVRDIAGQLFEEARRKNSHVSLCYLDLDHFKRINDSLGHSVGDRLLVLVAERLTHSIRGTDILARLGGDEFVVLSTGLDAAIQAETVAQKLLNELERPFHLMQHDITVSGSIGIAVFPDHGEEFEQLMRFADTASHRAKQAGRNGFAMFMGESDTVTAAPLKLQTELIAAIEQSQLSLHYQPQVDAHANLVGVEALIRWRHPERGMVPPMEFIPFAEETGLIVRIGEWTLERACLQQRQWQSQGLGHLSVAVNISALQFLRPGFVDSIERILRRTRANPERIELELTEGALVQPDEQTMKQLHQIRKMGLSLALDDFGTGYSSLSYLKRLPINKIKIDRSFVKDLPDDREDAAIASATISIAQNLGLAVVAEGVETELQRQFLHERGCAFMQGYLFSKPMPPEQLFAGTDDKPWQVHRSAPVA
ncbi:bifunctional diguanylate cyclase/phosphodiesterase [Permianibacter aggregans]|nr:EAL domain-containing protein [Permianibacter aggregans]QGX39275.1 EAL domain-containing protein [Permianibacter aggregans]